MFPLSDPNNPERYLAESSCVFTSAQVQVPGISKYQQTEKRGRLTTILNETF